MRIVITGGPGSGKTTLIDALRKKKFSVVPEAAQIVMNLMGDFLGDKRAQANWRKNSTVRQKIWFQEELIRMATTQERVINALRNGKNDKLIFFDRGVYDTLSYIENLDFDRKKIAELRRRCEKVMYDVVFVLDTPPAKIFRKRADRTTTKRIDSVNIGKAHKMVYERYFPGRVFTLPWNSKRVELILKKLAKIEQ